MKQRLRDLIRGIEPGRVEPTVLYGAFGAGCLLLLLALSGGGEDRAAGLAMLLAAIGLYHLHLFVRRRSATEYLWLGLTALSFAALSWGAYWVYETALPGYPARRLVEAAAHLAAAALVQFFWRFSAWPIDRRLRLYQVSQLVLAGLVAVAPGGWLAASQGLRWAWMLPAFLAMAALVVRDLRREVVTARAVAAVALALSLVGAAEAVTQVGGWGTTFPLPSWVMAGFAMVVTVVVSNRFTQAHFELDGLRQQLERMVEDRTAELSTANRRLESEIAERQLAQEAMHMLERAVEQSIDGIAVTDLEGEVRFVNRAWARMHGCEELEVLGRSLRRFHSPRQMEEEVEPGLARVKEWGFHEGEISHLHRDGTEFPTLMSITLLRDADGEPSGLILVGRDISENREAEEERRRLERRVQQAEKLESLGDLAAGIAHDYNNLLTGLLGHSSLVRKALPLDSPARDKIQQIETAAVRAAELTAQLLAYAGEDPLTLRMVRLSDLLREVEPELAKAIGPGAVLELELAPDLTPIEVDPAQIREAVRQLVTNASEALEGSFGIITLATGEVEAGPEDFRGAVPSEDQAPGCYVFLRVSDTGKGIEERDRPKLFDPFFTTKPGGRGFGLASVLSVVRTHYGAIRVDSEPGAGASFELLLPVKAEPVAATAQGVDSGTAWQAEGTVLVVDDQRIMREVSRSILEGIGFEVITAADGETALAAFNGRLDTIRLVLLDRTMPGMDGGEAYREIRRLDPEARVVLMSGYKRRVAMDGLVGEGLAGFLQKPFRPEDLVSKVREVLAGGQL